MHLALAFALCLAMAPVFAAAADLPPGQRISVEFERTNIENVFRAFGEIMHLNIVLHPSVRGTVSLTLRDTPVSECFETLLRLKGLYAVREGRIMLIYPLDTQPGE